MRMKNQFPSVEYESLFKIWLFMLIKAVAAYSRFQYRNGGKPCYFQCGAVANFRVFLTRRSPPREEALVHIEELRRQETPSDRLGLRLHRLLRWVQQLLRRGRRRRLLGHELAEFVLGTRLLRLIGRVSRMIYNYTSARGIMGLFQPKGDLRRS